MAGEFRPNGRIHRMCREGTTLGLTGHPVASIAPERLAVTGVTR
jgi:hypothetical protein